ncbi:hypothetical protein QE152_g32668 [Popillia japonica]|uniref:Uncharacterized protein n=1 Tax=Popillia japonica TaxID=7064 RepID=A0AAW1IYN7_POPJA
MATYEEEQAKLQQLWDDIDMSDDDPYGTESDNDPEYQVDEDSESSSNIPTKRQPFTNLISFLVVVTAVETENEDEFADDQSMSSKDEWNVVVGNFRDINFSADVGLVGLTQEVLDMRNNEDVLAYFQLFVDDQVIDLNKQRWWNKQTYMLNKLF